VNSLIHYNHSIDRLVISLSQLSKITADLDCPDVDKLIVCTTLHSFQTVNLLPLVFTVGANTCIYSDSLDWVIDFTPHFMLRYIENHEPVKLYKMQSLSNGRCNRS